MKNFTIGRLDVTSSNQTFLLLTFWCIVCFSAIHNASAKSTKTTRQSGADLIPQAGIDLQQSAEDIPSSTPLEPMPPGPQGPRGPPGPPGPPGANVTKEVLLTEFRNMVREAAEKKIELALGQGNEESSTSTGLDDLGVQKSDGPYIPLFDVDVSAILPKVTAGFFSRLQYGVVVGKKSLRELKDFHVPFGDGAFQRGDNSSSLTDGRFTAPRDGIYHFITNLHFIQKKKNKPISRKGTLHALVCIESLCQRNIALESIISVDQIGERFSLSVTGLLELKKGQYVSVIVDNDTKNGVKVLPNSYFNGILAGL